MPIHNPAAAAEESWGPFFVPPLPYSAIIQGTWTVSSNVSQIFTSFFLNTTHNDLDELNYLVYLSAGTWQLDFVTIKNSDQGIAKIYIDANLVLTYDKYAAAAAFNQVATAAGIVIAASGTKTIRLLIDGKNAASSNHYCVWSYMMFRRTA